MAEPTESGPEEPAEEEWADALRSAVADLSQDVELLKARSHGVEPEDAKQAQNARRRYGAVAFAMSMLIGVMGPVWLLIVYTLDGKEELTAAKSLLVVGLFGFAYALLRAADRFSLDERIIERIEIARAAKKSDGDDPASPADAAITLANNVIDMVGKLDELRQGPTKPPGS